MKRIGIISDTHGYWDPKFEKYFAECDEIWHAGDIGASDVAARLAAIKPLKAVVGNCDSGDLRFTYPEKLRFKCEDADVLLTHIGGYPGNYDARVRSQIYASPPDLFVCGHSHLLKVQFDKTLNLLHLNPGAAGQMGWQPTRTIMRLTVDGKTFKDLEVIELGENRSRL